MKYNRQTKWYIAPTLFYFIGWISDKLQSRALVSRFDIIISPQRWITHDVCHLIINAIKRYLLKNQISPLSECSGRSAIKRFISCPKDYWLADNGELLNTNLLNRLLLKLKPEENSSYSLFKRRSRGSKVMQFFCISESGYVS